MTGRFAVQTATTTFSIANHRVVMLAETKSNRRKCEECDALDQQKSLSAAQVLGITLLCSLMV
jgi:hypothetical protein